MLEIEGSRPLHTCRKAVEGRVKDKSKGLETAICYSSLQQKPMEAGGEREGARRKVEDQGREVSDGEYFRYLVSHPEELHLHGIKYPELAFF